MRRWNGWGDSQIHYHLSQSAVSYLQQILGPGQVGLDADYEDVLKTVPAARLDDLPLISTDPAARLNHSRGQSLPDWISLRSGQIQVFPDGVACPQNEVEVKRLLTQGGQNGWRLIPYGGGTSVVGHINPLPGDRPTLCINMGLMNQLEDLDDKSCLATVGAGATGPDIERVLRPRGFTLGHYPQSFEYSTLGGWIATRSSGQQSYHYGRIEDMFAGGQIETPKGSLLIQPFPASAAGPDLRHIVLGSEGRIGVITKAVVRIRPLPEVERFSGIFFKEWQAAVNAVRSIVQNKVGVSMLRLSDPVETETTLAMAGREWLIHGMDKALRALGYREDRCLLISGVTGGSSSTRLAHRQVKTIVRDYGGFMTGGFAGRQWLNNRFRSPYLRNSLWDLGYAVDTLETAVRWSSVTEMASGLKSEIAAGGVEAGTAVLVFYHLSHVYSDGASIYVTFIFPRSADPAQTERQWQTMKDRASSFIAAKGGTISHQHGVGTDHAPYMVHEKGALGFSWLESIRGAIDPQGIMNPGKLLVSDLSSGEGRVSWALKDGRI